VPMALPPEYLEVLAEIRVQYEKCSDIAGRILDTGIGDPQLDVENEKLRQLADRLYETRKRPGFTD
jgi:hypothetical protein